MERGGGLRSDASSLNRFTPASHSILFCVETNISQIVGTILNIDTFLYESFMHNEILPLFNSDPWINLIHVC